MNTAHFLGRAGQSSVGTTIEPVADEQFWFRQFRVGIWPEAFKGSQFPKGEEALNQYFRQMTPNTGPFELDVIADAMGGLHDRIGPAF